MWGKQSLRATVTVLVLLSAPWLEGCSALSDTTEVTAMQDGTRPGLVHVTELYTFRGLFRSNSSSTHWVLDDIGEIVNSQIDEAAYEDPRGLERTEACAGDDCYRVVPGQLRVEHRHGDAGSYTVAWQVTGDTYRQLAHDHRNVGDPVAHLSSRSVVVHAVAGGHVVFVANGRDGVLYRDVRGRWHRLGIPTGGEGVYFDAPPRLTTDPHPFNVTWYVVGGVALAIVVAGATAGIVRHRSRWRQSAWTSAVAVAAGVITLGGVHFPDVGMLPGFFYGVPLIIATLAVSGWLVIRRVPGRGTSGRDPGTRPLVDPATAPAARPAAEIVIREEPSRKADSTAERSTAFLTESRLRRRLSSTIAVASARPSSVSGRDDMSSRADVSSWRSAA